MPLVPPAFRRILLAALTMSAAFARPSLPLPEKVPGVIADAQAWQDPAATRLGGWLGARLDASARNRLVQHEPDHLLEGFTSRPGPEGSYGEFAGKWLHAATLAWANTGDEALRAKLAAVAHALCQSQLPDGYLGTYAEQNRWTDWDLWAHKYNLLGLLAYARHTGDEAALAACRRMGDLLCRTFGDGPGQRDIIFGPHVGMASTSVLEPMVLLHRFTGEPRYLDFCHYILRAWEQPHGPKILSTLLASGRVVQVANAKSYEMLSCLVGVAELYRTTGDSRLLEALHRACRDIAENRLYLTGTTSSRERFREDHDLPNALNVGEVCVTVTWLQLNAQMLRLTGEARYADHLELTVCNHLLGAQHPGGAGWAMYAMLSGPKAYNVSMREYTCCNASGPRGLALLPSFALAATADGLAVNLYAAARAELALPGGTRVVAHLDTRFPAEGRARLVLTPAAPSEFAVRLRVPVWCAEARLALNGQPSGVPLRPGEYAVVRRLWRAGDTLDLDLPLAPRLIVGQHYENWKRVAFTFGPLVLAADDRLNPAIKVGQFRVPADDLAQLDFRVEEPGRVFSFRAEKIDTGEPVTVRLAPFAEAGHTRENLEVWLQRHQL